MLSQNISRSDKFPLTLHPTGQYCKKIKGKLYYFGSNKQEALQRYLDHQESRATIGEINLRQVYDQTLLLRNFAKYVGPNRMVSDISTMDLQNYRKKLIKTGKAPNTISNRISAMKAMFHWAIDNEIIDSAPNLKAVKKIRTSNQGKCVFNVDQIRALLNSIGTQMKAMIWLGLNCGFGCTDCAELRWISEQTDRVINNSRKLIIQGDS